MSDVLKTEIKAKLGVERAGVTLGSGLVDLLANYFVDVVLFQDVNEVDINQLMSSAEDAWLNAMSAALPKAHRVKIARWVSNSAAPPPAPHLGGPPSVVPSAIDLNLGECNTASTLLIYDESTQRPADSGRFPPRRLLVPTSGRHLMV